MLGLGLNFGSSQSGSSAARMGGPGLLLDTYGSAAAAYSLRKLNSSYGGKVLQVRRASDHVEVDVGFDSNGLLSLDSPVTNVTEESTGITQGSSTNAAKLGEFCGEARRSGGDTSYATVDSMTEAAHVELVTWYDQSGNTNNATQVAAANQPRIYDRSSGLIVENGNPAVQFDGGYLDTSAITSQSVFIAINTTSVPQTNGGWLGQQSGADMYGLNPSAPSVRYRVNSVNRDHTSLTTIGYFLNTYTISSSNALNVYQSGTIATESPFNVSGAADFTRLMSRESNRQVYGNLQELVIYSSDQSDYRTAIESNINTFYSIY